MEQFEPLIQLDKTLLLVGMRADLPAKSSENTLRLRVIQELSRQFMEKVPEINGRIGSERYAVIENDVHESAEPARMYVMVEVESYANQPHWCVEFTLVRGRYARFYHQGLPRDLGKTVRLIYEDWAPKIPGLFAANLEVIRYPPGYEPLNPNATFEYLLPLV